MSQSWHRRPWNDVSNAECGHDHQFYRNSFKQLTDIQQRQTGLILGAAVADSAVRGFECMHVAEVDSFLSSCRAGPEAEMSASTLQGNDEIVFPSAAAESRAHSISGTMMIQLLHTMAAARCAQAVTVDAVGPRWVAAAEGLSAESFAEVHQSLMHAMACLLPLPCTYPWADDEALWEFSRPFSEFLLWQSSLSGSAQPLAASELNDALQNFAEESQEKCNRLTAGDRRAPSAHDEALVEGAQLMQSILLRFLQSNPDPMKNAGLIRSWQPQVAGRMLPQDVCSAAGIMARISGDAAPLFCPESAVDVVSELSTVAAALTIVRQSRSFAHGLRQLVRRTHHDCSSLASAAGVPRTLLRMRVCPQAMLVGAALGAKFGVRNIPLEWLSATPDHHSLGTLAVEVCQWSWNPMR